jgi:parvulin-like peptidyl-prolyl isomerase
MWIGSVIVLIFAAITFVFVPGMVRGFGGGGEAPVFGSYARKPISQTAEPYFQQMLQQYSEYARQSGQSADQTYSIYQNAFNSTVVHLAYSKAVADSGYVVPTKKIDRELIPYYYDAAGVYSPKLFNDTPASRRIALRKNITENLIDRRYYDDIFGTGAETIDDYQLYGRKTSSKEDLFVKKMGAMERSFELAAFALSNYPLSEAEKYGRENPDLFKKYDLSVITVSSEDAAKKVKAQIDRGEVVFEDAVSEFSVKYYSGDDGKLTSSYQFQIKNIVTSDDALSAITALNVGDVSDVIATVNGFSVFRSDGAPASADFSSAQIQSDIKNYMTMYARGRIEDYYINTARDFSVTAARDGFDAACEAFEINKVDVSPFPLNYGNSEILGIVPSSSVTELSGAENSENFLRTAFSIRQNEISTPLVLGNNVIVLRLNEETNKLAADLSETDESDDDGAQIVTSAGSFSLEQYYISQFDQMAAQDVVMKDKRLKNDFTTVFFKYYFGN